jgi:translation initiation factor IF-2
MAEKVKTSKENKNSQRRPPIVTVMGHVDHGKTTLLDYIRKTRVVEKEHGGITQHIGAYQVVVGKGKQKPLVERTITFIDTPGHAAFAKMRERGGSQADLVVLVIAANDGVKPQTEESLKHIVKAGVPFVVAANKIDLPEADLEKLKGQLVDLGYPPEDKGGKLVVVPASATKGEGVDKLLEKILSVSKGLELKADEKGTLEAVVIESELDKRRGAVATVVVKQGTLKVGDGVYVGPAGVHTENKVKVRAMFDEEGKGVKEALPSQPVELLGFGQVPEVGSVISGEEHLMKAPIGELGEVVEDELAKRQEMVLQEASESLVLILKTDAVGSLEALEEVLPGRVNLISTGVGEVTESDVMLAKATGAQVMGFGVEVPGSVARLAEVEKVRVKTYRIIYELLEEIEEQVKYLVDPRAGEEVVGKAKITAEFPYKNQRVAGAKVTEGKIDRKLKVHVMRGEELVGDARMKSLRQGKDKKTVVEKGEEFGVIFKPEVDFAKNDVIVAYRRKDN